MYNEELKTKFIKGYTQSVQTARYAVSIFNSIEKYEREWGADLSAQSTETLLPVIESIVGYKSYSKWACVSILRSYVKWCLSTGVPGACDGMLQVNPTGLENVRRQMVSSPLHLQKFLDDVFTPVSDDTIDIIYRCYYWMAYSGILESDTIHIKNSDIDFSNMSVTCNGISFPMYREAVPAFQKAVSLSSFVYKHPNYSKDILRDRFPGDTILRGIKADTKILTIRRALSVVNTAAVESGKTNLQLSFQRVRSSGIFYRAYENERAGLPVDFSSAVAQHMDGKTYTLKDGLSLDSIRRKIAKTYMDDYDRWKLVFTV